MYWYGFFSLTRAAHRQSNTICPLVLRLSSVIDDQDLEATCRGTDIVAASNDGASKTLSGASDAASALSLPTLGRDGDLASVGTDLPAELEAQVDLVIMNVAKADQPMAASRSRL